MVEDRGSEQGAIADAKVKSVLATHNVGSTAPTTKRQPGAPTMWRSPSSSLGLLTYAT